MEKSEALIAVYSTISMDSFTNLEQEIEWFYRMKGSEIGSEVVAIVATKKDIQDLRKVDDSEGVCLAEKFKASFFVTSAMTGEGVNESFEHICKQMLMRKRDKLRRVFTEWSRELHITFPENYRKRVVTLLLILKRNEKIKKKRFKFPKPLLDLILNNLFLLEYPSRIVQANQNFNQVILSEHISF